MKTLVLLCCVLFAFSSFGATRALTLVNYETEGGVKQWVPGTIIVKKGEEVQLTLINNVPSGDHGFFLPDFKIRELVSKGKKKVVKFKADKEGLFEMKCHMHPAHIGGQIYVIP